MNSSTRDIGGTFGIVVTVLSIVIGVISLMPKREDPRIEKPTNANNIAVDNSNPKERLNPSNQNQTPVEKQPEKVNNGRNANERIVDTSKAEEPKGRTSNNDIGTSRKNGLFEITLENAWESISAVHLSGCSIDVPADQKAALVRFTRSLWSSRQLSWDEQSTLLSIKPTDFLLIVNAVSESAQTFVYLMPRNSDRLTFRFQKPGLGEAISFDLSGLD